VTSDPLLRRVERTAAIAGAVMAIAALAIARGRPEPALGVIGGWLLIEVGYRSIVSGIDAMIAGLTGAAAPVQPGERRRHLIAAVVKMAGRYALLAVLAYVMIARLRLHPLGLMAGASSAVAAVAIEAVRVMAKK
jgi:hypothetical protein